MAKRVLQCIVRSAPSLIDNPCLGHPSESTDGIHELQVARLPYFLPYRVVDDRIEILQIFHESQERPSAWESNDDALADRKFASRQGSSFIAIKTRQFGREELQTFCQRQWLATRIHAIHCACDYLPGLVQLATRAEQRGVELLECVDPLAHGGLLDPCSRVVEQGNTNAMYAQQVDLSFGDAPRSLEPSWIDIVSSDDARQPFGRVGESRICCHRDCES